ncbi:phosphate ABC transporter ATP-binding protein PstB [Lentilactobacillus buchneri]|uniref:ABC-type phosphate transport system, ATPase component n=1 Tax=Lentilactobacillus buchneri subsp. silagei CD034 TaxID=1071400 RepID=J9W4D8_LENBU|nr:phosphate ABC transporter ATP-binding protein PstB [Lentilactobacillus buchneri]MCC6100041.1 phosphate ABC transporter ATP-binding protein PstB [Lactobacillus sp.]AFS00497.1 ABC-type phosphate transport system, ATPase component [Lentilactobacillus buchneri subsp. silagei CD034]MCT2900124.1 phosphate ABC transporter ATP-binding protein [Lentilactobacillus buchneri]MCT3542178.1 phosphate ABC transporter ATP-binding protein [Lentilactobacillus buchneri]MCT3544637.1 phosphate ABC transporter AT
MATPIISADNLDLFYDDFQALYGIHLDFLPNQISALIGPSGCGKSTFLRCLNRMNDMIDGVTITGAVQFHGENIYSPQTNLVELRKSIGMVFQQPNPFPFSVYDNITYGLRIAGLRDKQKLDEIVEKSLKQAAVWDEVKDNLYDNALSFSGGQQQRICIARVLATSPSVILMDEPTSALDPISSAKIENTLLELKKDYTIIIVTHNLQQASRISDKTAFFMEGRVVEYDDTTKMFVNPEEKQTEDYVSGRFG